MINKRAVLTIKISALAGLLLIFSACGKYLDSYDFYMNGQLDMSTAALTGKRVLVYTRKGPDVLVLESETAEKIKKTLVKHGYIPTEILSDTDYVMLFEYGMDTGKAISSTETGYELNHFSNRL
jgi:hypothetical protein